MDFNIILRDFFVIRNWLNYQQKSKFFIKFTHYQDNPYLMDINFLNWYSEMVEFDIGMNFQRFSTLKLDRRMIWLENTHEKLYKFYYESYITQFNGK